MLKRRYKIETTINLVLVACALVFFGTAIWLLQENQFRHELAHSNEKAEEIEQDAVHLLENTYELEQNHLAKPSEAWLLSFQKLRQSTQHYSQSTEFAQASETININMGRLDVLGNQMRDRVTPQLAHEARGMLHAIARAAHHIAKTQRLMQIEQEDRIVAALSLLLGVMIFAMWLCHSIIRKRVFYPLELIDNAARKFRQGDLSVRVGLPQRYDEMSSLANLLDELAKSLSVRMEALNRLNGRISEEIHQRELSEYELEQALQDSEMYSRLLESAGRVSGVGAWIVDLTTGEMTWSAQTYKIVEAPNTFKPTPARALEFYPVQAREQVRQAMIQAIKHGTPIDLQVPYRSWNGKEMWVQIFGDVEYEVNESGDRKPVKIYGACQDISDRKNNELNYQQALDAAKTANRTKDEFLANMSHEIRTPLNAIVGIAYLLKQSRMDGEQRDLLLKLEASGQSLLELINDILDLSKIEAGKVDIEQYEFSVHEIFDSLASIATGYEVKPDVDVVFIPECNLPASLMGDGTKLKQVLVNLLGNSLKFTKSGYVCVRARLLELTDVDCLLEFVVEDSGIGMDEATQKKLFHAFMQGDSSISRRFGGTGIGLALSGKLVQRMGGQINVESEPGKGSSFTFSLRFRTVNIEMEQGLGLPDVSVLLMHPNKKLHEAFNQLALRYVLKDLHCFEDEHAMFEFTRANADLIAGKRVVLIGDVQRFGAETCNNIKAWVKAMNPAHAYCIDLIRPDGTDASARVRELGSEANLNTPVTPLAFRSALLGALKESEKTKALSLQTLNGNPKLLSGLTVLAVDDNQINLKILRKILKNHGAKVLIANNGQEAVDIMRTKGPEVDICLMDVQMPVMDGLQACRIIREELGMAEFPILALTAGAMLAEHQNALDAGMNMVLTKPLDVDRVLQEVRHWTVHQVLEE